jgi:hypothetical protein
MRGDESKAYFSWSFCISCGVVDDRARLSVGRDRRATVGKLRYDPVIDVRRLCSLAPINLARILVGSSPDLLWYAKPTAVFGCWVAILGVFFFASFFVYLQSADRSGR